MCSGGEDNTIKLMENQYDITSSTPLLEAAYPGVVKHPFPLNCLIKQWYLGADFYQAVKIGIVQYVCAFTIWIFCSISSGNACCYWLDIMCQMILKMICAFLAIILESFGVYGEGQFQWQYGYAIPIFFY